MSGFLTVWGDFMPAKESFSRRILMPMSMRIQFPLQFNAFNIRLVVAGSCVTLFKGQIPYGELIISFERSKIQLIVSVAFYAYVSD